MMSNSDEQRDPLEVLFSEFLQRKREGDPISIEEFAIEHSELADDIRDLFPTLASLEKARSSQAANDPFQTGEDISGGLMLGEYRLLREIGVGGMGIVYEAMQETMQRRVAVKVLPQEFSQQEVRRNRFVQEARTVAKLSYRNIVPIFDFGESNNRYYFAMRLIQGAGLDWIILRMSEDDRPLTSTEVLQHFQQQGIPLSEEEEMEVDDDSLADEFDFTTSANQEQEQKHKWILRQDSWRQIARIGLQAARALNHAHQAGILHRDIKPGNLLLDSDGVIWITDFGLAKSENELSLTAPDDVVGTLRYISPERFHGQVDARSDIYALGLTLIELCTRKHVFEQAGRTELIRNIMEGNVPPPREINPDIPEALENILLKATAKNPAQRYQAAVEMADDLRAFSRGFHVKSSVVHPERRWIELLHKNWLTAILSGLCIILTVLLFMPSRSEVENPEDAQTLITAQGEWQVRLNALDALYYQAMQQEISADLDNISLVQPVSKNSSQQYALENLLPLYHQLEKEAEVFPSPSAQKITKRIKLIQKYLE